MTDTSIPETGDNDGVDVVDPRQPEVDQLELEYAQLVSRNNGFPKARRYEQQRDFSTAVAIKTRLLALHAEGAKVQVLPAIDIADPEEEEGDIPKKRHARPPDLSPLKLEAITARQRALVAQWADSDVATESRLNDRHAGAFVRTRLRYLVPENQAMPADFPRFVVDKIHQYIEGARRPDESALRILEHALPILTPEENADEWYAVALKDLKANLIRECEKEHLKADAPLGDTVDALTLQNIFENALLGASGRELITILATTKESPVRE